MLELGIQLSYAFTFQMQYQKFQVQRKDFFVRVARIRMLEKRGAKCWQQVLDSWKSEHFLPCLQIPIWLHFHGIILLMLLGI